jgi:hypothetical protein
MVNIIEQDLPVRFIDLEQVRHQPAAIITTSVKISELKIPTIYLEKMKLQVLYRFILQPPFLDLVKKQR